MPTKAQDANTLFSEGFNAYHSKNYSRALQLFQECNTVIHDDPQQIARVNYWIAKANYFAKTYAYNESLKYLDSAISYKHDYVDAYYFRFLLMKNYYSSNERADLEAILNFSQPTDWQFAYASYFLGNKIKGWNTINYAADNNPDYKSYYLYVKAVFYATEGSRELAFQTLKECIELKFPHPEHILLDFRNLLPLRELNQFLQDYELPQIQELSPLQVHIKEYVEQKINTWQKKGKFEKTSDYLKRVNPESREAKKEYYIQQAIDSVAISQIDFNALSNEYDADNETFKIIFSDTDPIYIHVPLADAPSFDNSFDSLEFSNSRFTLTENEDFSILHLEITNPSSQKTYIYDSKQEVPFTLTQLDLTFDPIDLSADDYTAAAPRQSNETTKIISVGQSDVDLNIPASETNNSKTYALVIGNEDYTKYQTDLGSESNVAFAMNDARIFSQYLIKTLGVPNDNITLLTDAISSQMSREIEKLSKIAQYSEGEATLIFYYAGHGFPDEQTKAAYLMPVDIDGANVTYGIKVSELYKKLTLYPVKKVIVILDACFSGGGRDEGLLAARGVRIKPEPFQVDGNIVVLTSSSGDQSSLPYNSKQHGIFTYFLLKKLQQTNGDITLKELFDYIRKEVQLNSVKINSKEQNPSVLYGPEVQGVWEEWKLR
jgi:hypothetical protein